MPMPPGVPLSEMSDADRPASAGLRVVDRVVPTLRVGSPHGSQPRGVSGLRPARSPYNAYRIVSSRACVFAYENFPSPSGLSASDQPGTCNPL